MLDPSKVSPEDDLWAAADPVAGMTGVGIRFPGSAAATAAQLPERLDLSHELRTPLNVILGNVELLLDGSVGPLSARARASLNDIEASGRDLLRQIRGLLMLIQAARVGQIDPRPVDLLAVLRKAWQRRRMRPRDLLAPEGAAFIVPGDETWLAALADAVAELAAAQCPRGQAVTLTIAPRPAAERQVLRMGWTAFDPAQLSSVQLALIETVLALHGAGLAMRVEVGMTLSWPARPQARQADGKPRTRRARRTKAVPAGG